MFWGWTCGPTVQCCVKNLSRIGCLTGRPTEWVDSWQNLCIGVERGSQLTNLDHIFVKRGCSCLRGLESTRAGSQDDNFSMKANIWRNDSSIIFSLMKISVKNGFMFSYVNCLEPTEKVSNLNIVINNTHKNAPHCSVDPVLCYRSGAQVHNPVDLECAHSDQIRVFWTSTAQISHLEDKDTAGNLICLASQKSQSIPVPQLSGTLHGAGWSWFTHWSAHRTDWFTWTPDQWGSNCLMLQEGDMPTHS